MTTRKPDPTNRSRVQDAINQLQIVDDALAGEFSVEHLIAAELWHDRFVCLKWAVESQATVAEMICWHRAQNGLDLFDHRDIPAADESETIPMPTAPVVDEKPCRMCGSPCHRTKSGVLLDECLSCMPF